MPSFVVLSHTFPDGHAEQNHLDLMIEDGDQLATWRIEQWPPSLTGQIAIELPRHRLAYLDYEGPISGDRGNVKRVAAGECQIIQHDDINWLVHVQTEEWTDVLVIRRTADEHGDESNTHSNEWRLSPLRF